MCLVLAAAGSRLVLAAAGSRLVVVSGSCSPDFLASWCAIAAPAMSARRRVRRLNPMENPFLSSEDTSR